MFKVPGSLGVKSRAVIWATVGLAIALAVVFGVRASHATALTDTNAAQGGTARSTSSQGAGWNSSHGRKSVSATLTVPAISCRNVRKRHWLGEAAGVELLGAARYAPSTNHGDFAGVFLYCHGHAAHYQPEFVTLNPVQFKLRFTRAKLRVRPGDTLELSIVFGRNHAILTITDTNTARARTVSIKGPGFARGAGWKVGVFPLIDPSGGPRLTGTMPGTRLSYVPGPLSSNTALFTNVTAGGKPLSSLSGVYRTYWYGSNGKPKARPTTIIKHSASSNGSGFTVYSVPLPAPRLAKTMDAARSHGHIRYRKPGTHKWVRLSSAANIPIGSLVDSNRGSVQMTFALPHHGTETAVFNGGSFRIKQDRHSGATNVVLAGGNFGICRHKDSDGDYDNDLRRPTGSQPVATTAKKKKKHKKVRKLWSNGHGNYTTTGSYGAAAVQGTRWLTEDTCDGTFFKVTRDKILVTVFFPHRHKVVVTQGHSLFAPAPTGGNG